MRPIVVRPDVVIVDDVVGTDAFDALARELAHGRYESVHARGWDKAWRLGDGNPQRGGAVYYDPTDVFGWNGPRYPTSTVVDDLIDIVRGLTAEHPGVVGTEGAEWAAMTLSPWLYPIGSALSLHCDGAAYSGAFTFFAHRRWSVHWGGELLLVDEPFAGTPPLPGGVGWMEEDEFGLGVATCVFPRPNRLVLVGPGRAHMIGHVDANVGDHVRTSLAGFFLRR